MLKTILAATATLAIAAAPAAAADHHGKKKMKEEKSNTIAAKAMKTDSLSTLVAAVKAADLVSVLKSDGPYTVFAPTNDGFAEIQDTVDTLLEPANKDRLQRVLKAHVVAAELSAADLILLVSANDGSVRVDTVAGDILVVALDGDNVTITDENGGVATVVTADVEADNGIVHVIDAVLVPQV